MDFLRRYAFWVVLGAVLVAALLFYLVGVLPTASANAKLRRQILKAKDEVAKLAASGNLPNTKWVEAAEQYQAAIKTQYENVLKVLETAAVDKYERLPNIPEADCIPRQSPDGTQYLVPKGAVFKTRYPEAVAELVDMLRKAGIRAQPQAVALPRLTGEIPDAPVILELQRRYWLARDVIETLVNNQVPVDELLLLLEEGGMEQGGGPGMMAARPVLGEGGAGGPGVIMPSMSGYLQEFTRGARRGRETETERRFSQLLAGSVGVTTEMNELFSPLASPPAQRRLRLLVNMDFRDVPLLIAALADMKHHDRPRLTLVRTVTIRKALDTYETPVKPVVRVEVRALCFDRYEKFVSPEMVP